MDEEIQKILDSIPADKAKAVMEAIADKHFEQRIPIRQVDRPVDFGPEAAQ